MIFIFLQLFFKISQSPLIIKQALAELFKAKKVPGSAVFLSVNRGASVSGKYEQALAEF